MNRSYSTESLKEISGDDEEFMASVAQAFLDEIPPDLISLTSAIENDNKSLAYQFAHKMKPNLEMLDVKLSKDIKAIESWTNTSKGKEAIESNISNIKTTLHKVFKELKQDYNL